MPHSQGPSNNPNPEPNQPNSSYCCLNLPKGLFLAGVGYLLKFWKHSCLLPFWLHDPPISVFILTISGERYWLWSSSLWSLLHNIRLRILFSNTLSLRSSLKVRDHATQPHGTTGNIIVLYILISKFLVIIKVVNFSDINGISSEGRCYLTDSKFNRYWTVIESATILIVSGILLKQN